MKNDFTVSKISTKINKQGIKYDKKLKAANEKYNTKQLVKICRFYRKKEKINMIFFTRKKLLINDEYIVDQQNKKIIENSISDYLSNDNPTKELLKNLSSKGYSY